MFMSEYEICQRYKAAANHSKQIRILAQINLCSTSDIRELLERNGVVPERNCEYREYTDERKPTEKQLERMERIQTAIAMRKAGYLYKEIGAKIGMSSKTAEDYVKKYGGVKG